MSLPLGIYSVFNPSEFMPMIPRAVQRSGRRGGTPSRAHAEVRDRFLALVMMAFLPRRQITSCVSMHGLADLSCSEAQRL